MFTVAVDAVTAGTVAGMVGFDHTLTVSDVDVQEGRNLSRGEGKFRLW